MTRRRSSRWLGGVTAAAWLALALHADSARAADFSRTASLAARLSEATFDVVVLRPLSAVALVVGSMFFVVSAPLVAPAGIWSGGPLEGLRPSWSTFVYAPYEYTVVRDLGDF